VKNKFYIDNEHDIVWYASIWMYKGTSDQANTELMYSVLIPDRKRQPGHSV